MSAWPRTFPAGNADWRARIFNEAALPLSHGLWGAIQKKVRGLSASGAPETRSKDPRGDPRIIWVPYSRLRPFWSRRAYRLPYASQGETKYDRALRRARKLYLRLGGDPADDKYPDKPKRMRWTTYNLLMDKLVAADDVTDERLALAARWLKE